MDEALTEAYKAFALLVQEPMSAQTTGENLISEYLAWERCMSPQLRERWKIVVRDKLGISREEFLKEEHRLRNWAEGG